MSTALYLFLYIEEKKCVKYDLKKEEISYIIL